MKERIKKLRKSLDLTQQEFANRLGISRGSIATYETRDGSPGSSVINLICREFNVSEAWLRTGEGDMFVKQSRTDELSSFVALLLQSEPDDIRRRFVTAISRLSTRELEALEKTALHLADEVNPNAAVATTLSLPIDEAVSDVPQVETTAEIEEKVENYRQELIQKKAQTEERSALPKVNAG